MGSLGEGELQKMYVVGQMFPKNLKNLRISRRISQERAAKHCGVSRATYAKYENGKLQPTALFAVNAAAYFDVDLMSLFQMDLTETQNSSMKNRQKL